MTSRLLGAVLAAALVASACAEPPNKEMDMAQGAIDAARAAGAERYAEADYQAATAALRAANDAVAERDYRLALNYALESHEFAQNAARNTADTKARVRADVEREMAELATLLARANTEMIAAREARVPDGQLTQPADDLAAASAQVQKAGEAVQADDYLAASAALEGVKAQIEQALAAVEEVMTSQSTRRRS
jgi:hypothetical protein